MVQRRLWTWASPFQGDRAESPPDSTDPQPWLLVSDPRAQVLCQSPRPGHMALERPTG